MTNLKVFKVHVGRTFRSRSQGQNLWYHVKGLVIRNSHVKYKILASCCNLKKKLQPLNVKGFVDASIKISVDTDSAARHAMTKAYRS